MEALLPGSICLLCMYLPPTNNALFEKARVTALGMSSFSLAVISWKVGAVSPWIIAPTAAISGGISVYGHVGLFG